MIIIAYLLMLWAETRLHPDEHVFAGNSGKSATILHNFGSGSIFFRIVVL